MIFRSIFLAVYFATFVCFAESEPNGNADIQPFVDWLLNDGERFDSVRFAEVAEAVSGCAVLPVVPTDVVHTAMLTHLEATLDGMLTDLAEPGNPIHEVGRVNEISRHIEDYLLAHLNLEGVYECRIPLTASGQTQRSGYPDLLLRDIESGRVFYIDPKVYKGGSEGSSFRTFYFEPKRATNKILDDASHLIVGIAHGGKVDGLWQLESWKVVDLFDFRVRLKAEFQSSNREIYRDAAVLLQSE